MTFSVKEGVIDKDHGESEDDEDRGDNSGDASDDWKDLASYQGRNAWGFKTVVENLDELHDNK